MQKSTNLVQNLGFFLGLHQNAGWVFYSQIYNENEVVSIGVIHTFNPVE